MPRRKKAPAPEPIRFSVPNWNPALVNRFVGRHWGPMAKLKKRDRLLVLAASNHLPKAQCKRHVRAVITVATRGRLPDPDGFLKSLLDALVCAGMIVDDSPAWVSFDAPTVERGRPHTVVTLTDVE